MARGGKREGAGRPAGAITQRTREVAERAMATGMTPLDVMLDNMRHFQQVALDAEATLEGLTAAEFSEKVPDDATPEQQFKFLLAEVKKTAGSGRWRRMRPETRRHTSIRSSAPSRIPARMVALSR